MSDTLLLPLFGGRLSTLDKSGVFIYNDGITR